MDKFQFICAPVLNAGIEYCPKATQSTSIPVVSGPALVALSLINLEKEGEMFCTVQ